jgi:hypothetical protein
MLLLAKWQGHTMALLPGPCSQSDNPEEGEVAQLRRTHDVGRSAGEWVSQIAIRQLLDTFLKKTLTLREANAINK